MNLISSLRANESNPLVPAFLHPPTPEHVPIITETAEDEWQSTGLAEVASMESSVAVGVVNRRKVERNPSAPLPGMLQVTSHLLFFISSFSHHLLTPPPPHTTSSHHPSTQAPGLRKYLTPTLSDGASRMEKSVVAKKSRGSE